jgi:creatinine amidohydrolase/Fe(II)-dependent formamide hydrolase-like protein
MDLIYSYEEDVFEPYQPDCLNLASMISAQVALNYGLLCDEVVFNGLFDNYDQHFLQIMARNTAREIYVKKFLEPNPFIRGAVAELPVAKLEDYLRAKFIFENRELSQHDIETAWKWDPDVAKHAVLSSGGKDSLLTFGLLRETGFESHPIFINESGRHWFTALKAYRHFSKRVPNTARVWTNADRMYSWMLRHLPFIRQDFADVRSDEYPIRLWTVAVFLFGALPILRKRGIGRLLIGDEYDTTQKASFQGIKHFDGLYDQSRYFDNALTRYFHQKAWRISQFSILRPLSEFLIEKILTERYPDLQGLQVSCHATHKQGEDVLPCGRCEKCRRIVGMLTAIGADPTRCGYTSEQIRRCRRDLDAKGIHQERRGAEHLAYLLNKGGFLGRPFLGSIGAQKRPEIVKLRFDIDRSPLDGIPVELRKPLYRICLEYAEGAVRRSGRSWIDFDLLNDVGLDAPYAFESKGTPTSEKQHAQKTSNHKSFHILGELTWPEAEARLRETDLALLPVGAVEQHGPHLTLDTDAYDADHLARAVAEACEKPKPLVLPLIPYGVSYHHEDFSGTLSISPDTLSKLVYEIGMSAAHHGISKLVIINGHGGNSPALHFAAQMINRDAHIFTCVDTGETSDPDINAMIETPNDVHAGEIETSTSLATRPHLVRLEAARQFIPQFSSRYLNFTSKRSVGWYAHTSKISPDGVLGDPTKADLKKGQKMWEVMIRHLVEFVEDLKGLTLDEIYQRRY